VIQVYTSHEIYCYPLKNGATKEMIAAQGLGTVLRLARKLGPVIGKTVVVVGQGQNGLIATRLMAQFAAKHVIAVEPLEYRRTIALASGATHAATPEDALALIHSLTEGRGADIVIEMVGHNQATINTCMDYVRCSGIVAAFGVPDDAVYNTFEFSKFFRKNVNLIASVIPDPDTDFPEAVALIEQGRFSTEGIFTHTMPLAEVQRGFEIASQYLDNVVKLVIEL
jgi:alcohol dehydrogenase